jgi:hypothetical protein
MSSTSAPVRVQKNLLNGCRGWKFELVRMRLQISLQIGVRRREHIGVGVVQELHLLAEAPTDDGVVLVESERQRLADVD